MSPMLFEGRQKKGLLLHIKEGQIRGGKDRKLETNVSKPGGILLHRTHASLTCTRVGVFAGEGLHTLAADNGTHGDRMELKACPFLCILLLLFTLFFLLLNFIFFFSFSCQRK